MISGMFQAVFPAIFVLNVGYGISIISENLLPEILRSAIHPRSFAFVSLILITSYMLCSTFIYVSMPIKINQFGLFVNTILVYFYPLFVLLYIYEVMTWIK